jgi:predicted Zn-dependent protease
MTAALDATVAQDLLSAALRSTRDAEVFWAREEAITAACLDGRPEAQKHDIETVGLRVIQAGRLGHAVHIGPIARLDPAGLIKRAAASGPVGRAAPPTFSKEREAGPQVPTWDDDVAALGEQELTRMARQATERLRDMLGEIPAQVAVRRLLRRTVLLTRMAERHGDKSILQFQARVGPLPDSGAVLAESWTSGRLPDDPLAALGNIAWRAAVGQPRESLPNGPGRVVLGPRAVAVLIRWLCEAQTGTAIVERRSRWDASMLGRSRVVDERITIVDNPLRPWAPPAGAYDAEGLPRRRQVLIDQGVLSGLLLDLSTAFQLELEPTASAAREIDGPPLPAPSFLELAAGSEGQENLLERCEGGAYVDQLSDAAPPNDDGWFSAEAPAAFLIHHGRPRGWIEGLRLSANLYDLLARQVLAVGCDRIAGPAAFAASIAFKDVTLET